MPRLPIAQTVPSPAPATPYRLFVTPVGKVVHVVPSKAKAEPLLPTM